MTISYRNLNTFLLLGSFMISSDTAKASNIDFIDSEFDVAFKNEFDLEVVALNEVRNERSIANDWTETAYFKVDARSGGTPRFNTGGFSLLDTAQYAPLNTEPLQSCEGGVFGLDGRYTEAVCMVYQNITNVICSASNPKESSCDRDKVPHLIPAKGDMLRTRSISSEGANFAWALCIAAEDLDNTQCNRTALPGSNLLAGNAAGLQMVQFPGTEEPFVGFENPILTFANEKVLPKADGETWSNYALGDGRFEFIRRLYNRQPFREHDDPKYAWNFKESRPDRWEILDAKASALNTIVQQYAHQAFDDESENEYHHDVLLGYFMQRYADDLFGPPVVGDTERTAVMEAALFRYRTACAFPLGVMAAHYCGFNAEDMKGLVTTFLNSNFYNMERTGPFKVTNYPTCGRWTQEMWQLSKRAMMKPVSETPLYQGETKLTNFMCLRRVFRRFR